MSTLNPSLAFCRGAPKRAQRALFQGTQVLTGNTRSFSERKSRRRWKPNVHKMSFWSDALQRKLQLRVASRALRTIDKYGGIDNYLTKMKPEKLDSELGMCLRAEILAVRQGEAVEKLVMEAQERAAAAARVDAHSSESAV